MKSESSFGSRIVVRGEEGVGRMVGEAPVGGESWRETPSCRGRESPEGRGSGVKFVEVRGLGWGQRGRERGSVRGRHWGPRREREGCSRRCHRSLPAGALHR